MGQKTMIFDGYDEEYKSITNDISAELSKIDIYEEDNSKKRTALNHISDLLTQAFQLVGCCSW